MTRIEKYNYLLPEILIAKTPANPRDASRLLVFETEKNNICHKSFSDLSDFLKPGDLVVTNNSKVMPARFFGRKITGGNIEILLLEKSGQNWQVLVGGKVLVGDKIYFSDNLKAEILEKSGKECLVAFNYPDEKFWQIVEKIGQMPIPPYIKNSPLSETKLKKEYQTVYAKNYGSAAAPTAGLHFTEKLISDLKVASVNFASVDLHVGLGTFAPIDDENVKQKKLHSENFFIPSTTIENILSTKKSGGRIIAVGTTTARALESVSEKILSGGNDISESTDIFIQPGDKFKIIDGLITNFHLPKSSLMMLVAAFIQSKTNFDGREKLLELYNYAIKNQYRFYSFGDAMLII
ncbi:MAG: tRNA preQ1(34) S-adenosylmethionine ribosyltransferase-isomerase QueA [Candidatus Berkelbacteria bacterium]